MFSRNLRVQNTRVCPEPMTTTTTERMHLPTETFFFFFFLYHVREPFDHSMSAQTEGFISPARATNVGYKYALDDQLSSAP